VNLECLDDDSLGEKLSVIWELEIHKKIFEEIDYPAPENWDSLKRFIAFLHAVRWSSTPLVSIPPLHSPFRADIDFEDYQLEPVVRALTMARANLLIADDVGLGKTIEAGLIMQELIAKQRVRKILIICPSSLQQQWKEEMEEKFQLFFEIMDREYVLMLRKEYGLHVNPWNSYPRLITSMDFIKREGPLNQFLNSMAKDKIDNILKEWDLLVLDEAHNVAPSGKNQYVRDSNRTRMVRSIINHFENRLFLTATPHNGFTESFTALLEMLDPLRFARGPEINKEQVKTVTIRRLKEDILNALGENKFPKREVKAIEIDFDDEEERSFDLLDKYTKSRLKRCSSDESFLIRFALTMLKKRLLSSPLSFNHSMDTHLDNVTGPGIETTRTTDLDLARLLQEQSREDQDNDDEKIRLEEDALQETSKFFGELTDDENDWLTELWDIASKRKDRTDSKVKKLMGWIEKHMKSGGLWNNERLIIFTEYKHTLEYLQKILIKKGEEKYFKTLYGGMSAKEREEIKYAFQSPVEENPVRILIATDAASEGLNLQKYCRYMIHYEIPWNPNKMEQRNGRIDRHGQTRDMTVYHFIYRNHEDSRFLQVIIDKMQTIRKELGSMGEIIEKEIEKAMLKEEYKIPEARKEKIYSELGSEINLGEAIKKIRHRYVETKKDLELTPDNFRTVLNEALKLSGHEGLEEITEGELKGKGYRIRTLPSSWQNLTYALRDKKDRLLNIVFDRNYSKDRKDTIYIHLNHPLMKKAISIFRSQIWSSGFASHHKMNRVSYKILPFSSLKYPVIIAFGRVIIISETGNKLHEDIIFIGGEIDQTSYTPLEKSYIQVLLNEEGTYCEIPKTAGEKFRHWFTAHKKELNKHIKEREKEEKEKIKDIIKEKEKEEIKQVNKLIRERIKEITVRLEDVKEPKAYQLTFFNEEEKEQYDEDIRWLKRRKEQLERDMEEEPKTIKKRYSIKSFRIFPLGIFYIIPDNLI
ncbi:MAG: DISARM system SNF2-like helicase DrmD, partial [Candidatus Eremiobacterota bacterium]